ncbi:MAG: TonB-dependent receptor [Bryobacteraceae bacterium]
MSTQILGLVTDATGAVVAGANVTAKRLATGDIRAAASNETGYYIFPALEVGAYEVSCTAPGFKTEVRRGIELQLQQKARLDFQLQVGQQVERIEVTALAPLLRSEDATLGSVIEARRIVELPLNGRNFGQLATLSPGVVYGLSRMGANGQGTLADLAPPGQMVGISANGQRDANQRITMDGVVATDPHHSAMLYTPSVEAVEEFKVQSAVYSAEYGMNSGAQINLAIKSGTNQLHGTIFEFVRNDQFDARGFFLPANQPKNSLRRNQYGTVISGPLVKDKTFWLFDWEARRERRANPSRAAVPTLAMRGGDFSEILQPGNRWYPRDASPSVRAIRPPGSALPFVNNVIPLSLLNPVSLNILTFQKSSPFPEGGFLALPNQDALALSQNSPINLAGTDRQVIDTDQYLGRFDHRFGDNDRVFVRYIIVEATWDRVPLDRVSRQNSGYRSQNLGAGYSKILSPTVFNDLRYGFNRPRQQTDGIQTNVGFTQRDLGLDFRVAGDGNRTLTDFEEGIPTIGIAGYSGINVGRAALILRQTHEVSDNLSVSRGTHNLKFGGLYQYVSVKSSAANIQRGSMSFTADIAGIPDGFSAFMLGIPTSANSAEGIPNLLARQDKFGFYALDDWKVTSRLTLNLGVRYDLFTPVEDTQGRFRSLSFADGNARTIDGVFTPMLIPEPGQRAQLYDIDKKQIMPRAGLAYRFGDRTVLRMGSGLFYNAQQTNNFTVMSLQPPFSGSAVIENDRTNPQGTIGNPFAGSARTSPAALVMLGNLDAGRGNRSFFRNNSIVQWTAELERSIGADFVTGIAYVGSRGSHIDMSLGNYNNPDPGTGAIQGRRPFQVYVDSRDPNTPLSLGTIRRLETWIPSTYHALQLRGEKRYSHGLTFSGSFNYQKAMSIAYGLNEGGGFGPGTLQNPRNRQADWGRSNIDQRFRFVFSHVWEIPWLRSARGWQGLVLGGWAVNGIIQLTSGLPVTVGQNGDSQNTGGGAPRPHIVAGQAISRVEAERSVDRWFNTNAFVRSKCDGCTGEGLFLGPLGYGNAGRSLFDSPAQKTWDFGLFKEFRIKERHRVQFRWEAFNLLNTPQFSAPDATLGSATFGRINSTLINSREMQFGLKYHF